ncbi:MAG: GTPase ObgE [bacterium]|nr:GTPase ObgE [bacterium]
MAKFTDTIDIRIKAGDGGPGSVHFHREKYVAKGGPDGGDGGKGGNVYVEADRRYYNLSHFFRDRLYKAKRGEPGTGGKCHGKNGEDMVIKVPPGTQVTDVETGEVLADLILENEPVLIAEGGIGGKGNTFFKSSTNQTPQMAQPGIAVEEFAVCLNLKLIADVGLVGLPNAGKSTLLSKVTNAKPKIGDYPFTTLIPNLGVVEQDNGRVYKIADIPGIIEGAHMGHGLGLSFLQHIERVKMLLFLVDSTEQDPRYNYELLRAELSTYNEELNNKPYFVVLTKIDLLPEDEREEMKSLWDEDFGAGNYLALSSVENLHIDTLLERLEAMMGQEDAAE